MKEDKKEEELFIPKTKHKVLKIILAIILIGGLITGGYFLYQYKFNNNKKIIIDSLEEFKADIKNNLITDFGDDKYKIDGHIKIDANITEELSPITDILKNIELQFDGEFDLKESISNYNINTKYKNDKLISAKIYNEKNVVYMLLDEIYDKYIKIDTTKEQENTIITEIPNINIKPQEIETLASSIIDSFEKEISNLEFEKNNETITIDGNEMNVINNYVTLKNKEVNNLLKKIITNLKDDTNFTSTLNNLSNSDVKSYLDSIINEIDNDTYKGSYKISFYTDKGLLNKKVVRVSQTISQGEVPITINIDRLNSNEFILSLSTIGVSYSIKIKKTNSVVNIELLENIMTMYMKMELNMSYEKITDITKPDVSNNKDVNDLTDEEMQEIENKIKDNKNLQRIIDELNKQKENEV